MTKERIEVKSSHPDTHTPNSTIRNRPINATRGRRPRRIQMISHQSSRRGQVGNNRSILVKKQRQRKSTLLNKLGRRRYGELMWNSQRHLYESFCYGEINFSQGIKTHKGVKQPELFWEGLKLRRFFNQKLKIHTDRNSHSSQQNQNNSGYIHYLPNPTAPKTIDKHLENFSIRYHQQLELGKQLNCSEAYYCRQKLSQLIRTEMELNIKQQLDIRKYQWKQITKDEVEELFTNDIFLFSYILVSPQELNQQAQDELKRIVNQFFNNRSQQKGGRVGANKKYVQKLIQFEKTHAELPEKMPNF